MNKEAIEAQAKQILDNFSKALESVKAKPKKAKASQAPFRQESSPKTCNPKFKELMFKNAPNKNEDCIIAEKAQW